MQPDKPSIEVRNAARAVETALSFLYEQGVKEAPPADTKWQQETLYSTGPEDYVITGNLYTFAGWLIEVSQNVAPISRTVYKVTVFNTDTGQFWQGNVMADGSVTEISTFKTVTESEASVITEEFRAKREVPPPAPGGYGH